MMGAPYLMFIYILEILCFISSQPHLLEGTLLLSLNCGGPAFKDTTTTLDWLPDDSGDYVVNGLNGSVADPAAVSDIYRTLRYFPLTPRNKKYCYTLPNLGSGNLYLIRAGFFYGNYDGLNRPPSFSLLLNYDVWIPLINTTATQPILHEIIYASTDNIAYVCLAPMANASSANSTTYAPFISSLQVSLLESSMYNGDDDANKNNVPGSGSLIGGYALLLLRRINYGAATNASVRYPDDPYDRIWEANMTGPVQVASANVTISESSEDNNMPPAKVLETAIDAGSVDAVLEIEVELREDETIGDLGVYVGMHFAMLSDNGSHAVVLTSLGGQKIDPMLIDPYPAGFPILVQNDKALGFVPSPFTLTVAADSTVPPYLNALELLVRSRSPLLTNATALSDVGALLNIKQLANLTLYGDGDPCLPRGGYGWSWVTCNNDNVNVRVTEINLTNFGIHGSIEDISIFVTNLTELQKIYLADNELSGSIPDFSLLQNLQLLDLRNNQLSGSIPSSLLQLPNLKEVFLEGNLDLCGSTHDSLFQQKVSYTMTTSLCETCACPTPPTNSSGLSSTTKYVIIISALATFNVASIASILLFCKLQRRKMYEKIKSNVYRALVKDTNEIFPIQYLTYEEIKDATNQFSNKIGEGGFGDVFHGTLQNGQDVAIKLLADASRQGLKEFNTEVAVLSNAHHRNLVCLLGYSTEKSYTLVYEYIPRGNLRDNLYGEDFKGYSLPWETRLSIAIDTAIGLEYLHMGCEPSIIHRDVKSSNILLTEKLQAKVADFGLSRLRAADSTKSHVSTMNVVGTIGYLDPEYNNTNQFTDKSDVYSFGVVLLELICGRPPIDSFRVPPHIISWVMPSIVNDRIEDIVDPKLIGGYKLESIKVVLDVALKCVNLDRNSRPTISEVIQGLREAQKVENGLKSPKEVLSTNNDMVEVNVHFNDVSINSNASDQANIELEPQSINLAR